MDESTVISTTELVDHLRCGKKWQCGGICLSTVGVWVWIV